MGRWILIIIVLLALFGVLLVHVGVIHVRNTPNDASITIDKKEFRTQMHEAAEKTEDAGGKLLDKTGAALHRAGEKLHDHRAPANDTPAPEKDRQP